MRPAAATASSAGTPTTHDAQRTTTTTPTMSAAPLRVRSLTPDHTRATLLQHSIKRIRCLPATRLQRVALLPEREYRISVSCLIRDRAHIDPVTDEHRHVHVPGVVKPGAWYSRHLRETMPYLRNVGPV